MAENLSVLPNSISLQGSHDTNYPDLGTLTPVRGRILKKDDRILQWGYHETKQLISIRAELEKDFALIKRNKTLWELIERKMMEKGFRRSADQCKCKWKNLVNLYKGKETFEPDYEGKDPIYPENGRQCPFFDELDAIFKERAKNSDKSLLESELGSRGKKKGKRGKTKSDDDDDSEDDDEEEESEEDRVVQRKKRKNEKENNRPRVTAEKYRANSMQEVLEDFFQQQQRVEEQWRESVERREQERRLREQEWRDAMEKLEQERIAREHMWREREEQKRIRDEARAQKRDELFAALLTKLAQDEGY
ncbi:trihelix transcription factor GT-3b isoform X2 [Physcomitrium patens]|uniref:trihelix transcription factor GT-3b isoform X2 n=1 Tax=Physcomitrium patens TaxID=3218 RepID=UPI00024B1EB5|nr:trihelix transcription factor GT-3b-like isoform X2 [Physcomitrium patens]|eukprot:XP_024356666.1 trihelix transcription factor GT-3b-like isoform X2 [Physcomitrella patens]